MPLNHLATEQLMQGIKLNSKFSGVISLRKGSCIVYEKAYGLADRENRIPNNTLTRFGIASGTKFFTALAIGKLIDEGKLSLATKLTEVMDVSSFNYSPMITIQHLLTHTSGIPDYYDEEKIDDFENFSVGVPWSEMRGPQDYLQVFPKEEMKFQPGARFSYSNGGYILLGVIVETISGRRYQDFVTEEVFQPIGMDRSGFFPLDQLPENTAIGYIIEPNGQWRTNEESLPIIGASDGGAFTTAQDLAVLWDGFWSGRIIKQKLVEHFAAPYVRAETEGPHKFYGHGIWIHDEGPAQRREYIAGCDAGVSFRSGVARDQELQLTVLSNSTEGAWPALRAIDAELFGKNPQEN